MTSTYHTQSFQSTPYKQVTSQYVNPQFLKPQDINPSCKVFPETFSINEQNATYEYKPKVIMSGYIVGQPVAFTQFPNLPNNYVPFSPSKENIGQPVFIQQSRQVQQSSVINGQSFLRPSSFNPTTSVYRKIDRKDLINQSRNLPSSTSKKISRVEIISEPVAQTASSTVSKELYEKVLSQNNFLRSQNTRLTQQNRKLLQQSQLLASKSSRLNQLQKQTASLRQQVLLLRATSSQTHSTLKNSTFPQSQHKSSSEALLNEKMIQFEQVFSLCLQKYRSSILQQQKLLIDRFRLQCKNEQLDMKKQKLYQSRKQEKLKQTQRQSFRKHSLYEKHQNPFLNSTKQNFTIPLKSQLQQKHYRK